MQGVSTFAVIRILAIALALSGALGCKHTEFSGSSRKQGGAAVKKPRLAGQTDAQDGADDQADAGDTDGQGDNADGGSDSDGDADGQSDGDSDSSDSEDGQGDVGTDGDTIDDSEDTDTEDDDISAKYSDLTLSGHRLDGSHKNTQITIVGADGKSTTIPWPREGATATVPKACKKGSTTVIQISAGANQPSNPKCFVGMQRSKLSLSLGYENQCDSLDYNEIDDAIMTLTCETVELKIKDLRLDSSIDFDEWVD